MGFPVCSRFASPYDSLDRQKVVGSDSDVEIDGVHVAPGDIIMADRDGVAIVPADIADDVLAIANDKAGAEDRFGDAVKNGMSLTEAINTCGIL